ncbi:MAG: hypothetical protein OXN86_07920 [Chloroflexota bacterium]|nr:hypothetical protein [Chloroflexota bacterium]
MAERDAALEHVDSEAEGLPARPRAVVVGGDPTKLQLELPVLIPTSEGYPVAYSIPDNVKAFRERHGMRALEFPTGLAQ